MSTKPTIMIDYEHAKNVHSLSGPQAALKVILGDKIFTSLLDIGCGTGTWLKAAKELDIPNVYGIEGVDIPQEQLHVPALSFQRWDLTQHLDLGRRFDVVLCLEVAEHLDAKYASVLIDTLVRHSDLILFSAASPGQVGQSHVNCQWPEYWQALFNQRGFACSDEPRWRIWEDDRIEPWYRQNLFIAQRDAKFAGTESRIRAVIHPRMFGLSLDQSGGNTLFRNHVIQIEQGKMPVVWYLKAPPLALFRKIKQRLSPIKSLLVKD